MGGAFYYWHEVLPGDRRKVGQIVMDDSGGLKNFIEMTSKAMASTIFKFDLDQDIRVAALATFDTFKWGDVDG